MFMPPIMRTSTVEWKDDCEKRGLDDTDHRIINMLVRNGRTSYAALGEAVGLSPHGAADRVRRLEKDGVITGFTATVDLENLGRGLDAFVDVRMLPTADPEAFERLALSLPAVREIAVRHRPLRLPAAGRLHRRRRARPHGPRAAPARRRRRDRDAHRAALLGFDRELDAGASERTE